MRSTDALLYLLESNVLSDQDFARIGKLLHASPTIRCQLLQIQDVPGVDLDQLVSAVLSQDPYKSRAKLISIICAPQSAVTIAKLPKSAVRSFVSLAVHCADPLGIEARRDVGRLCTSLCEVPHATMSVDDARMALWALSPDADIYIEEVAPAEDADLTDTQEPITAAAEDTNSDPEEMPATAVHKFVEDYLDAIVQADITVVGRETARSVVAQINEAARGRTGADVVTYRKGLPNLRPAKHTDGGTHSTLIVATQDHTPNARRRIAASAAAAGVRIVWTPKSTTAFLHEALRTAVG